MSRAPSADPELAAWGERLSAQAPPFGHDQAARLRALLSRPAVRRAEQDPAPPPTVGDGGVTTSEGSAGTDENPRDAQPDEGGDSE